MVPGLERRADEWLGRLVETGVSAEAMVKQAVSKGLTKPGAKSRPVIDWLMAEYSLSNAYAMAIVRLLRDKQLLD